MRPNERRRNVLLALGRYDPQMHRGVACFAAQANWHLNAEMAYTGRLPLGWRGDGIVTLLNEQQDVVEFVRAARVPTVDLSCLRDEVALPRVLGAQQRIGSVAAEHFLERHFRQFAWFSTFDDRVTQLRLQGFQDTLERAGYTPERWVFSSPPGAAPDEWSAKCAFLEERLKAMAKPLAVFCFHDADAANVLDACESAGLVVPEEVAILGTDNDKLICESVRVPLSSVNHDLEGMGYAGAALLDRLMRGDPAPKLPQQIPPKGLTIRRSSDVLAIDHEPTRRALQFLRENYHRRIGPEDAAAATGLPRRQVERSFQEYLGGSMAKHLATLRLARAKQLLRETSLCATDVAARTGFNTPQYFNRAMREATGMTPQQFRLQCRLI